MLPDLQRFLDDDVAPAAATLDRAPVALAHTLDRAAAAGLLGLRAPIDAGGRALDDLAFFAAQVAAARASGTWAFLQTQHQGAVGFAARAEGPARRWLPRLARGDVRSGIAYAFHRRPGPPGVTATPSDRGLRVRGHVPWMTGWGLFSHCVTAAALPDGRLAFALHALDEAGVTAGPPMDLVAFSAAQTVTLDLDLHVPQEDVLFVEDPGWLARRDPTRAAPQSAFVLGVAEAAVAQVSAAARAGRADPGAALEALAEHVTRARAEVERCIARDDDTDRSLAARAVAVAVCGRATLAAVSAWSGAANVADHPAGRLHREALGFTVLAQTRPVQSALLSTLAGAG